METRTTLNRFGFSWAQQRVRSTLARIAATVLLSWCLCRLERGLEGRFAGAGSLTATDTGLFSHILKVSTRDFSAA